ncbi:MULTISPECIES: carbohydrate ABC transporter permease [unclassified Paenibacillus]|uniref:carbohydrate ABC transporter permease n=1 Tax=unclassified Paenibacillus TaxID=185978 RepID=UPI0027878A85|nr:MULTISPECIES: carbohydrate ABC transporter permease [unclassified Paenibacillus]MDQ0901845.1 putative aldouronate transport system permease protein [Paenibacillus sp. V4I7]MDQ0919656.1 putative aldouronate transport system permease protein [Paenibacillus sp. V4I5]
MAKYKISQLLLHLFFICLSLACLLPVLLVISISFSDENTVIANGFKFYPEKFSLDAYSFLYNQLSQIITAYGVTIFVTVVGTLLSLLLIALYAYPLSRRELRHRNKFALFIFLTMIFNGGLVPWYLVYVNLLHLKDSVWSLIIPLFLQPFFVIIMRTFFQTTIPESIIESATIDGASEVKIFYKIILPLSLPVLATIGLFNTLNYWNDWFLSLIFITKGNGISLQYLMYKTLLNIQYLTTNENAANQLSKMGAVVNLPSQTLRMAMAVVGIGPIIFAYPFFQKYFVKGLTIGAVKG